jgi:hypothetical protein
MTSATFHDNRLDPLTCARLWSAEEQPRTSRDFRLSKRPEL